MDQVTGWMVQAAQTISGWVVKEAGTITHPDLEASWYLRLFSGLAALGGALAGLVGLIALASAAIRKDPDALGEVIYGVARAGIGTSVVIALTIIALSAADAISNQFAQQMPADFYKTLADQWGGSGWGGFGAAALAFLVAFVATIAGLMVWLELIVREAAIYIAVLFFPVGLAASIWPALRSWVRRLSMLLLMFVLLRPVVVIVLALAGSVTASGLSFGNGSIPHSVGTILAGVVIFALAAFTPWTLMFLLGTEIGAMYSRGGAQWRAGGAQLRRQPAGRGRRWSPSRRSPAAGEPATAAVRERGSADRGGGTRLTEPRWLGLGRGGVGRVDRRCGRMGRGGRGGGSRVSAGSSASTPLRGFRSPGDGAASTPGGIVRSRGVGLGGGSAGTDARTSEPGPPEPPSSGWGFVARRAASLGLERGRERLDSPADRLRRVDTTAAASPPSPPSGREIVGGRRRPPPKGDSRISTHPAVADGSAMPGDEPPRRPADDPPG